MGKVFSKIVPNMHKAFEYYWEGALAGALDCFMTDILGNIQLNKAKGRTKITALYSGMDLADVYKKLNYAHGVCQELISDSPYPAAIEMMMRYIERELDLKNGE